MMQSRVKFVSQLQKFILARQVKLVAVATNCGSRHFICILWWLTHFIFLIALLKEKAMTLSAVTTYLQEMSKNYSFWLLCNCY